MEVELFSNVISEEDTVEFDAEYDNFGEGERCGICMDVVVDRGVLDCCQHWFCFVCIDNWASITNLCPLCQNEFQLITCIPVYDTISGNKTDENSDLRDNDWSVEGNNNTLSFPSYYIDENAVTCLDGDGCKIRSGSVTNEKISTLDTSIACDSCDLWFHAFCVGFDPEGADVDSWLCPRCLVDGTLPNSDFKGKCVIRNELDPGSADHCLVDTSSGKVSISVADDGETAVVVSRIGGEHFVEEPIANGSQTQELTNHCETEMSKLIPESPELEKNALGQEIKVTQLEAILPERLSVSIDESEPIQSGSGVCLIPGSSSDATLFEDEETKIPLGNDECLHGNSGKVTSADETSEDIKPNPAPKVGAKRKCTDYSFLANDEDGCDEVGLGTGSSTRKVKSRQFASFNDPVHISAPDVHQKTNGRRESSAEEIKKNVPPKKPSSIDIMSIVRDKEPNTSKKLRHKKEIDTCAKFQQNAARLRVKKIIRRPSEDQKSADVVQKLRKEIREAVKKRSDDIGKNIVDPNLLAAFRAAVAGSTAAPVKKTSVKPKKLILQKSKTRENLTKKIYAASSGKRRRAWDRDCQVEFWKHRCMTTSKPEKIETLKSVLNLLKRNPEAKQVEHDSEEEADAPILSRLYLADASVFPRKDDIKPLSFLKDAGGTNRNVESSSGEKDTKASQDFSKVGCPENNKVLAQSATTADDKSIQNTCNHKSGIASAKTLSDKKSSKSSSLKTASCKTDIKTDKRKWALAVLARKTASNSKSSNPAQQKKDNAVFRGNYPLLTELPADMRPELAAISHNKISVSVRQAQLYRLTEHFLKMANLSSIRRTAATELAVADAINIEKQVADRSNSKVVYLNLCSQEIRRQTSNSSCSLVESKPASPLPVSQGGESSMTSLDPEAEEALRNAGLLSDSPPCSPDNNVKYVHDNENPEVGVDEEGITDIFDMDCQPDLDIYGDFEYDLDEEYYTDASAVRALNSLEVEGESKVKVVFSTLTSNKADTPLEGKEGDLLETEQLSKTSNLPGSCNDNGRGNSDIDNKVDSVQIPTDTSLDGEDEELSVRECEELYGPDKEPLVYKLPVTLASENSAPQSVTPEEVKNPEENNSFPASCPGIVDEGKPSSSSGAVEIAQEERNGIPKVDKKSGHVDSVQKKVEAYIKEHIRPLCKSGVITVEQYRWAVGKTTDKVMKYHSKAKNANFLIKEGEKVKKLAEQYVETAKHKEK